MLTILHWIYFPFLTWWPYQNGKYTFQIQRSNFQRTNSIKFLFWCLIVLWMDGRRILNCKIARAKCKEWSFVQLLLNSNDDYQYTSTEFEWLLDMVNYTLQVTIIDIVYSIINITDVKCVDIIFFQDEDDSLYFNFSSGIHVEDYQPFWEFWVPGASSTKINI